jgi:hypothetical protein
VAVKCFFVVAPTAMPWRILACAHVNTLRKYSYTISLCKTLRYPKSYNELEGITKPYFISRTGG